ncbi:MAG: hypothetical protein MJ014_01095 [Methanocorpusculum sp.]|nr:hypothetical protein [Methanocorpusculum sp.]
MRKTANTLFTAPGTTVTVNTHDLPSGDTTDISRLPEGKPAYITGVRSPVSRPYITIREPGTLESTATYPIAYSCIVGITTVISRPVSPKVTFCTSGRNPGFDIIIE